MSAAELTHRFGAAAGVAFDDTEHGLVRVRVAVAGATGELFLQGAQVTGWQPPGQQPVIFTSPNAVFGPGKAIRGGIPVIFPWFGAHPSDPQAPQHGLVRTARWQLETVACDGKRATLLLSHTLDGFALSYCVAFGRELSLELGVRNTGVEPASFEEALHTYFAVADVERVTVTGLQGSAFIDKTANFARRPPTGAPLTLAKETDSVYLDTPDTLILRDPARGRRIVIAKQGAASAIVWNPWAEKAAALGDLGSGNWRPMVCVETGNVADNRITIAAGAEHRMTTRIAVDAAT
ncbi:MAG: D-hexose-6-phosphate mutarotase [Alphaproteobacteria bacterium]|nr:D-hexose-6-phosphate mutarotase [Alphaproteobacteria bacterium]